MELWNPGALEPWNFRPFASLEPALETLKLDLKQYRSLVKNFEPLTLWNCRAILPTLCSLNQLKQLYCVLRLLCIALVTSMLMNQAKTLTSPEPWYPPKLCAWWHCSLGPWNLLLGCKAGLICICICICMCACRCKRIWIWFCACTCKGACTCTCKCVCEWKGKCKRRRGLAHPSSEFLGVCISGAWKQSLRDFVGNGSHMASSRTTR